MKYKRGQHPNSLKNIAKWSGHWKKGEHISKATEFKKGHKMLTGEKHPLWKGDEVGYMGVHAWVRRRLKKPKKCSQCGLKKSRIELSNKDHKYKRNLIDWVWLCPKCHSAYDMKFNKKYESRLIHLRVGN